MMKVLVAAAACVALTLPAYAQVAAGSTGGPSGGPNQAQSVVPSGATGGRSGGPNQAQHVKASKKKHKTHH